MEADVSSLDYWLVVRELDDIADREEIEDFILPQPVTLAAIGADDEVIDTHDIALDHPGVEMATPIPD